jgi:hypothetical protein
LRLLVLRLREPLLRDDDEPLLPFELRPLAFDDEPDALLRAVLAVRFAAVLALELADLPVLRAAVEPLLAAVLAVLPAVDAALRPDDAALRAVERAPPEDEFDERDEPPERERDDELRDDELDRDDELRDDEPLRERDEPPLLREDDERDDDERDRDDEPCLRSFAGISALTTSFVSRGICFSTKSYMRCSSRRIDFAIFTVSLSWTFSARAMIAV